MTSARQWKERRSDELREIILDGATLVFNEKGFERATTKEIARQVGVSEGTIYNYFRNKRDLLLCLVQRFADNAAGLVKENIAGEAGEGAFTARYFLERLELFRTGLSPTLVFHHAKRDEEVRTILENLFAPGSDKRLQPQLERLQEGGVVRKVDLDFLGAFFRAIVYGLAVMMDIGSPTDRLTLPIEEISRMARDLIWYGLVTSRPQ